MNIWFYISFVMFNIVLFMILKFYLMKKSIKEIRKNFKEILNSDTNNLILVSSNDIDIKLFANDINKELYSLRKQRLIYENGNQELKSLVTDILHDIRTPLTVINGYGCLLNEEGLNEKQNKYVQIIETKIKEITLLTEQLFYYSKGLDFEKNLQKENCCINDILEETIASFYKMFKEKNIIPNIKITEKSIYKNINKNMLIRILENLIYNAIKYSDNDCNIELKKDGKIVFSNKASKLDVITVKKIFNRYYTVENVNRNTGVGLSIVKQLVELNGGSIIAKYSKGCLFIEIVL